jgi:hypothetical protein
MRTVILILLMLVFGAVTAQENFPDYINKWEGKWMGNLVSITDTNSEVSMPIELNIKPSNVKGEWIWDVKYGVDTAAVYIPNTLRYLSGGKFVLKIMPDSILMNMNYFLNKFYSVDKVQYDPKSPGLIETFTFEIRDSVIYYEETKTDMTNPRIAHPSTVHCEVTFYSVYLVSRAELKKIRE